MGALSVQIVTGRRDRTRSMAFLRKALAAFASPQKDQIKLLVGADAGEKAETRRRHRSRKQDGVCKLGDADQR